LYQSIWFEADGQSEKGFRVGFWIRNRGSPSRAAGWRPGIVSCPKTRMPFDENKGLFAEKRNLFDKEDFGGINCRAL
jgi:hypothetical protein